VSFDEIRLRVRGYYAGKLALHGATPGGVDWNSAESQRLRFDQLLRILDDQRHCSINDYGCGFGSLLSHVRERGIEGTYCGLDLSEEMVQEARRQHPGRAGHSFTSREADLVPADFTASGIFNVRMDVGDDRWKDYLLATLDTLRDLSRVGFAFNALSSYSDPERRRSDLFYADPRELFDHCKRRFSRYVALLHDYPLYEFTMLVRIEPPTREG
jgi:SAM-dependent methyltransferase